MDKEAGGIQVIARAAAILRAVGRQGMSLGALARDTGLPRSTVQRIVDALAAEQFVETGEDGVKLGGGIRQLAQATPTDVVHAARPFLEALYDATGETVDISCRGGREVVFLDRLNSTQELRVVSITDKPQLLHAMANGKALLASMGADASWRLMEKHLVRLTEHTIHTRESLLSHIEAIRVEGFAYDREEHAIGVCAIGVPIRVPGLQTHAISVALPTSRFAASRESIKEKLKQTQTAVEAALNCMLNA